MINAYLLVIIVLASIIIVQSIIHSRERGRLLDRIMSKNLNEFKNTKPAIKKKGVSAHDKVMKAWRDPGN